MAAKQGSFFHEGFFYARERWKASETPISPKPNNARSPVLGFGVGVIGPVSPFAQPDQPPNEPFPPKSNSHEEKSPVVFPDPYSQGRALVHQRFVRLGIVVDQLSKRLVSNPG